MGALADTLREAGFAPAATLTHDGGQFDLQVLRPEVRCVVYVYADFDTGRVLNVGHTGQTLRGRLGSYKAWLNGRRPKENNRPVRMSWLECLGGCPRVEIWFRPSSTDRTAREEDERYWIGHLQPLLNRRP